MMGPPPRSGPWARSGGVGMDPYAVWVGCLPPGLEVQELTLFARAHVEENDVSHITVLPVAHNHRTQQAPQLTTCPARPPLPDETATEPTSGHARDFCRNGQLEIAEVASGPDRVANATGKRPCPRLTPKLPA